MLSLKTDNITLMVWEIADYWNAVLSAVLKFGIPKHMEFVTELLHVRIFLASGYPPIACTRGQRTDHTGRCYRIENFTANFYFCPQVNILSTQYCGHVSEFNISMSSDGSVSAITWHSGQKIVSK